MPLGRHVLRSALRSCGEVLLPLPLLLHYRRLVLRSQVGRGVGCSMCWDPSELCHAALQLPCSAGSAAAPVH